MIAGFLVEHDSTGDEPGDLLENHDRAVVALNRHDVLLVVSGADLFAGYQELPGLIRYVSNRAGDGSAVDVHVEHVEKYADTVLGGTFRLDRHDFAVGR